jgi:hypothetical protein
MLSSRNSVGNLCGDQRKEIPDMKDLGRVTSYLILLGLLTSCYMFSYEVVEPDHPPIAAPRAEQPLRLVVGLSGTEEGLLLIAEPFRPDGEFQELKALFAQRLQGLSLFREVLYPAVPHDHPDISLRVFLQVKIEPDWTHFPKLFLTYLLLALPAPLFEVEHHFVARGDLEIIHRDQIVKKYTAISNVTIRRGMLSILPPMVWQQAASRARDSMMADLLHQLNQDRGLLSRFEPRL